MDTVEESTRAVPNHCHELDAELLATVASSRSRVESNHADVAMARNGERHDDAMVAPHNEEYSSVLTPY